MIIVSSPDLVGIPDLNSETLATYFQELNYNIIKYCEEKYPVQSKYSLDFESETETSNKGKQKVKQHAKTTPNTPILSKTTAKHLQTPEQGTKDFQLPRNPTQQQEPISTSTNIIEYLQENESDHSENLESEETESEQEETTENKKKMATAYIAKIPEFTGEDNDIIQKAGDANSWIAARMLKAIPYFLQGTAEKWFEILEELFENWQAFKNFIAELKDKLIKKVCPHAPADLTTAIRHAKSYEMAIEEANHTKLVNFAIRETSSAAEKKIDQLTKKNTENKIVGNYKETNKTGVINIILYYNNLITNLYYQSIIHQDHKIKTTPQNQLQSNNNRINPNNQLVPRNSGQQRPNYYHTQPSYLTIPEESDFQQTALSESEVVVPRSNPFNHTIPPTQIAQNANLSNIFPFEFEANESPFLLSNTAVNEQKAITAIYTEATVEGKLIHLILDSGLARSIITYQLIQQLKQNIDRPAQTVIVTVDGMKKTPVGEIDNFPFTIDEITIPVKVLVMDALQYQALVRNNWLLKANANLNWKTQELKILYQGQYTIVPAICGTFNK
ncbi:hypothetical protein G9A89_004636 [Geosiphon pyriformis]|nr:hypothetical protein G9A89_004636 [Geosiphon pyriformis]